MTARDTGVTNLGAIGIEGHMNVMCHLDNFEEESEGVQLPRRGINGSS
jgi:hypothetical protein